MSLKGSSFMEKCVPNYYHKFKCIADKCKNSCCIGWEIDIDADTMELYKTLGDDFLKNIEGNPPHFILKAGERCPFLNDNGLCEIISSYGEDALCDICYMHPRFCNEYENFLEMGLGLACEEAARLILSEEEKFSVPTPLSNDFFKKRQEIFDILQDRSKSIKERLLVLSEDAFKVPLYETFMPLERLDDKWTEMLESIKDYKSEFEIFEKFPVPFEQLGCYFVFRHLKEDNIKSVLKFTVLSVLLIGSLCEKNDKALDEIARMYSTEIEYSEENIQTLVEV